MGLSSKLAAASGPAAGEKGQQFPGVQQASQQQQQGSYISPASPTNSNLSPRPMSPSGSSSYGMQSPSAPLPHQPAQPPLQATSPHFNPQQQWMQGSAGHTAYQAVAPPSAPTNIFTFSPQQAPGNAFGHITPPQAAATQHNMGNNLPPQYQQSVNGADVSVITGRLQKIVMENGFECFYPPHRVQEVASRVSRVSLDAISNTWGIPLELAQDLYSLALYDIVIYADDSGSMAAQDHGERIKDLKTIISSVSEIATLFDDDGIVVRMINSSIEGNNICTAVDASNLVANVKFSGMTPIGTNLESKVLQPFLYQGAAAMGHIQKPILVIIITDGEPAGEGKDTLRNVIKRCAGWLSSRGLPQKAVSYQFAQVGNDLAAQRFLSSLDNDVEIGHLIDAISNYELEEAEFTKKNPGTAFTPYLWLLKLMMGAVDRSYDEQD